MAENKETALHQYSCKSNKVFKGWTQNVNCVS